eukprot:TRINITY_DN2793_c0_g1_i14.p1 TRINITY_DN2793_c0_g1~~TRINITY_DN2793_c0_g1_i14.p1  ORF type:complete len:570 (+),score=100.13 TRINITY_DN2793_c0_g1_i14:65-1774(+)
MTSDEGMRVVNPCHSLADDLGYRLEREAQMPLEREEAQMPPEREGLTALDFNDYYLQKEGTGHLDPVRAAQACTADDEELTPLTGVADCESIGVRRQETRHPLRVMIAELSKYSRMLLLACMVLLAVLCASQYSGMMRMHSAWQGGELFQAVQPQIRQPNQAAAKASTSMLCYMVLFSMHEVEIVKEALRRRAGIFECEEHMLFTATSRSVLFGEGPVGPVVSIPLKAGPSHKAPAPGALTLSWQNVETFLQALQRVNTSARWQSHDWLVKVDPDAVFLPHRLREHLELKSSKTYFRNCNRDHAEPMLLGGLEVFSKDAMRNFLREEQRCRQELQWQGWGEDYFMSKCMDLLGIRGSTEMLGAEVGSFALLADRNCNCSASASPSCQTNCNIPGYAAYHPFKDADSWLACWREAAECSQWLAADCLWTKAWSCPGQPPGTHGVAAADGSHAYRCCCEEDAWRTFEPKSDASSPSWYGASTREEASSRPSISSFSAVNAPSAMTTTRMTTTAQTTIATTTTVSRLKLTFALVNRSYPPPWQEQLLSRSCFPCLPMQLPHSTTHCRQMMSA